MSGVCLYMYVYCLYCVSMCAWLCVRVCVCVCLCVWMCVFFSPWHLNLVRTKQASAGETLPTTQPDKSQRRGPWFVFSRLYQKACDLRAPCRPHRRPSGCGCELSSGAQVTTSWLPAPECGMRIRRRRRRRGVRCNHPFNVFSLVSWHSASIRSFPEGDKLKWNEENISLVTRAVPILVPLVFFFLLRLVCSCECIDKATNSRTVRFWISLSEIKWLGMRNIHVC